MGLVRQHPIRYLCQESQTGSNRENNEPVEQEAPFSGLAISTGLELEDGERLQHKWQSSRKHNSSTSLGQLSLNANNKGIQT